MQNPKPRLTQFYELQKLVGELEKSGLEGVSLYLRLTKIGLIDLDMLHKVMEKRA
ncbi:MAG: hypothetical protein JKY83_11685 [Rhizobiaceae bacterium]|nr:hypothetical protein [Rhizobiaceae bacterium]